MSGLIRGDSGGVMLFRVPHRDGEMTVRIESPAVITKSHLEALGRYLDLAIKDAPESAPALLERGGLGQCERGSEWQP